MVDNEPEIVATLTARELRAAVENRDGEDVLVIHDGELGIEVSAAFGTPELAALGLERVATAAVQAAAMLRSRVDVHW
jgi:hypothetical protein